MSQSPAPPSPEKPMSQRASLMVSLLAVVILVMIFLFWQGTWFGRELSDEQISEYLTDADKPRNAQHVIAQISERISQGDESVKKWYPRIVALGDHPLAQLRVNAAWLMGQDNKSSQFHEKLKYLLADSDPQVRRNAALSLVRFGDESGRHELLGMLGDFTVHSPHTGIFKKFLEVEDVVDEGTLLARGRGERPRGARGGAVTLARRREKAATAGRRRSTGGGSGHAAGARRDACL